MENLMDGVMTFEETTKDVRIAVQSYFLEDQSDPENGQFVWAYRVRISNEGSKTVQLISRHWIITDAGGQTHEVKGMGVIGEQPVIGPGEYFVYTSGTPLTTPSGFMHGTYDMKLDENQTFKAKIPAFSLDSPYSDTYIN